jgi:hypothetical protein
MIAMKPSQSAPKIRPGQRRPYRKGTRRQIRDRIRAVAGLLRLGAHKMEIHRIIKRRFKVAWRQCDRYIAAALMQDKTLTTPSQTERKWLTRARARALGVKKLRRFVW